MILVFKMSILIMEVKKMDDKKSKRHCNNTRGVYEFGL